MTIYPWQHSQWQQLSFYLVNRRFPHALLFMGPEDMGKLQFAQTLAKRILCQNAQDGDFACGLCRSCQWLEEGNHPDLYVIQADTEGGAIKIDQIRILVEELHQTGQQGGYQLVIIEPAEAMNKAAANALLKTLEEPAGQIVFLLVSHQAGLLPATITSRCQKLYFPPPSEHLGLSWLRQQLPDLPDRELSSLLNVNEYIPLRALKFYHADLQGINQKIIQRFIQLHLGECSPVEMAEFCAHYDFVLVFNVLWLAIFNLLELKLHGQTQSMIPQTQLTLLQQINAQLTGFKLLRFLDQLLLAKRQMVNKANLNLQLLFEGLFVDCIRVY